MAEPLRTEALEDLIASAIRLGREFHADTTKIDLASNALESGFINRCLSRIAQGEVLDRRDDGGLDAVQGILQRERAREIIDTERVFDGVEDPELGSIGNVREVEILSQRGQRIEHLLQKFLGFRKARDFALDRIEAERLLMRMMQS